MMSVNPAIILFTAEIFLYSEECHLAKGESAGQSKLIMVDNVQV